MAVTTPTMYNGMYVGGMSMKQINMLQNVRNTKVIDGLKNMIYDFPMDLIMQSCDEERSIFDILREKGESPDKYIGTMRDYQTVGTAFMYLSPRSIIADGVGLGKTIEISGLINFLKKRGEISRFLMAVENSAINQTYFELIRFTGLNILRLPAEAQKIKKIIAKTDFSKVDGIIIRHSTLRSDELSKFISINLDNNGMCKLFNTFILDESSVIKNPNTKIYRYTSNICNIVRRVHFMNATAFETNLLDVYYQADMMNQYLLPKKWKIEKEFCKMGRKSYWVKENGKPVMKWAFERTGYKNQQAFKESLAMFYFGRCKADIGMDLPHIYKVYEVSPSTSQVEALSKGYRYMEVLNCPSLISDIDISTNRKEVPKIDRLCQLVETEFSNQSIMVYCFHIEAQKAIAEELKKIGRRPVILNGSCTDTERYTIQTMFNRGDYDVIVTNIRKSLNLYGGDVCIFYSLETNPSKATQIAGRIDRNVDDKTKTFVLLLYKDTDEYRFLTTVVGQRAKDSRELTIDAKSVTDYFIEAMEG